MRNRRKLASAISHGRWGEKMPNLRDGTLSLCTPHAGIVLLTLVRNPPLSVPPPPSKMLDLGFVWRGEVPFSLLWARGFSDIRTSTGS